MPEEIEQAVTPLSNNTEQTIIDYFTVLKAEHDDNKFNSFVDGAVNNALDFGAKAEDEAMPDSEMFIEDSMATDTNTSATGSSHGTTNVQVQGIDEDDIIKNDGKYIYVLSDSSVKIIDAGNMKLMKRLPKEDYDCLVGACDVGLIFLDHRFTIPNFPSRLLGYLQAKLPVLACTDPNTDIGTVIAEGGFGWWCESNDADAFGKRLAAAVAADLPAMGQRGFAYLNEHYTVERAYQTIMNGG